MIFRDVSNANLPPQNLSSRKELNLSGKNFRTLPEWTTQCVALEVIDISGNPLIAFPKSPSKLDKLKNLKSLRVLKANNISLTSIPDWLQNLKLERLELKNNILYTLPTWFSKWIKENNVTVCLENNRRLPLGHRLKRRVFKG